MRTCPSACAALYFLLLLKDSWQEQFKNSRPRAGDKMSHKQHLVQWQPGGRKKLNPDVTDRILFLKLVKQQNFWFSEGKEKASKHYAFKFYSFFHISFFFSFFLFQVLILKYKLVQTPFLFTSNTCNLTLINTLLRKRELMSIWRDVWGILAKVILTEIIAALMFLQCQINVQICIGELCL